MVDLKDLHCLTALARHQHFARAAADCGMSQPAFSMRIRNLEARLGATIVRRGNRFQGLTEEGNRIVIHARRILDGVRALEQDVRAGRGEITGRLSLATVPTAVAFAAQLAIWLKDAHPGIHLQIETTNSLALQQGVEASGFDAGITYGEGASRDLLCVDPLYDETYMLLCPRALLPAELSTAEALSWRQVADLPLSLLGPEMQNRRILDRIFSQSGVEPHVICEAGEFMAAIVMAAQGGAATVLPKIMADTFTTWTGTVLLPITDPVVQTEICLITPHRQTQIPVVEALRQVVQARLHDNPALS
ncbi:MAG: LysR family transcriptional regulator [Mangrovicoccus sp.]|nr:LysR family transcriptional regulator [Mangrovicoccus sp.]